MNAIIAFSLLLCTAPANTEARLAEVRRQYDTVAAKALVTELRDALPEVATPAEHLRFARSLILLAELHRIDFEQLSDETDRAARRDMAKEIDAAAREGIEHAEALGEVSESYRLRCDFIALMTRTKFQGKKNLKKIVKASERALALDPANPHAYVSVAKPDLFKGGGDLQKAHKLIEKALELDPSLETAKLLHAIALEKLGEKDRAEAAWKKILADNPHCAAARETMEKAGKTWEDVDGS